MDTCCSPDTSIASILKSENKKISTLLSSNRTFINGRWEQYVDHNATSLKKKHITVTSKLCERINQYLQTHGNLGKSASTLILSFWPLAVST